LPEDNKDILVQIKIHLCRKRVSYCIHRQIKCYWSAVTAIFRLRQCRGKVTMKRS